VRKAICEIVDQAEISSKYKDAQKRLKAHDATRKLIEGEIKMLQHICEHPNIERWKSYDYGGGCDLNEECKDCGFFRSR